MKVLFVILVLAALAVLTVLYAIVVNLMMERMDISVFEAIAVLFVAHAIFGGRTAEAAFR